MVAGPHITCPGQPVFSVPGQYAIGIVGQPCQSTCWSIDWPFRLLHSGYSVIYIHNINLIYGPICSLCIGQVVGYVDLLIRYLRPCAKYGWHTFSVDSDWMGWGMSCWTPDNPVFSLSGFQAMCCLLRSSVSWSRFSLRLLGLNNWQCSARTITLDLQLLWLAANRCDNLKC
jgi:hypothetical protein